MSPESFDFAWTQYQTHVIDKLNLLTQGKPRLKPCTRTRLITVQTPSTPS